MRRSQHDKMPANRARGSVDEGGLQFLRVRRLGLLLCLLSVITLGTASCAPGDSSIRIISPTGPVEIIPGSTGVGRAPGALELRYELGRGSPVTAQLEGPVSASLLDEVQAAGMHVLRFNGVVPTDDAGPSGLVRRVVPEGEYAIVISSGSETDRIEFRVGASPQAPPEISEAVLQPTELSPNSDAEDDVAELTFRTNQTSTVSVDLTSPEGAVTSVLAPAVKSGGEQNVVVSGLTAEDEVLPDGTYTVTVRADDRSGNRVEAYSQLKITAGGEPQLEVVRVDITPTELILGNSVMVSVTVRNVGNVPLRTQGPDPGFTYTTNDAYSSIEGGRWVDRAGLWRVGVDWDGNSGGAGPYRYPFRWGFGKTLMPGEEVTTGGRITILKQESTMWFYAGVLQEGIRIVRDRLGRTRVDVDF